MAHLDARIAAHVQTWEKRLAAGPHPMAKLPYVTLSRQFGCQALPLATRLAELLNERMRPAYPWAAYDHEVLDRVARELQLSRSIVESLDNRRRDAMSELFDAVLNRKVDEALMYRKMAEVIRSLATLGHAVLLGRGSYLITQDLPNGLHVRLVAPLEWRVQRFAENYNLPLAEARKVVEQGQKERETFLRTIIVQDPSHPVLHDLVFDYSKFDVAQVAEVIVTALEARFGNKLVAD
jgi:cytidylate kinase